MAEENQNIGHGNYQPAAPTTHEEPAETKEPAAGGGVFDYLRKKKEEYLPAAATAVTTHDDEPEVKSRGGMFDFLKTKNEGEENKEMAGDGYQPAAPVTVTVTVTTHQEEELEIKDHGYQQPAAPVNDHQGDDESEVKDRGVLGFSGNQGIPGKQGRLGTSTDHEEEVVPTTDHGYQQPAVPAIDHEEETEIKDQGMLGFSGNRGIPGKQGKLGSTDHDDESEVEDRGILGFSGNQGIPGKQEKLGTSTDLDDESEVKDRRMLGFSGKQGRLGSTDHDDESEVKDRGMLGFSGNQGIPGKQGRLGTTDHEEELEVKDQGMLGFSGNQGRLGSTDHDDESEVKDRGMLDFLGKKKEHEKEENKEMTEEQIPISHGYQQDAPATNEESEIKDRGMLDFLGKHKEEEEVVPAPTHQNVEKEDENKHHSSLLEKLKGSHSASSSSDEEVEENGQKIRRKKKKGLKEKIHEKITGDHNKVEEEPEKKTDYFQEEKCDDASTPHPEQKKGLIEKIKGKLHKKSAEDQGITHPVGGAPAGHPISIDHHEYSSTTDAVQHDGEETKEKKGFLDKIKEKLHKSETHEEKKDTPTHY